jgi:ABC-2 type transport system ATP-binding protein
MAQTADHLIVIGRGRLIADTAVEAFVRGAGRNTVLVRSPQAAELRELLARPGVTVTSSEPGTLEVTGLSAPEIGDAAAERGLRLHELTPQAASLEEAFMQLTREDQEYRASLGEAAA